MLSLQHSSHIFSDIFVCCLTKKVEVFENDTVITITHLCTPCSPPFLWSVDISLSFLAKAIHSYLPRLHSTYFSLSPIFSSSFFPHQFSSCPINKIKNVPPYRKVLQEPCASLGLIPICSLRCSHPVFISLLLFDPLHSLTSI